MQTNSVIILGLFLGTLYPGSASASIIVDQLPAQLGGYGSDTEFRDIVGNPVWQLVADNIQLTQSAIARNLKFYAFYGGDEQNHAPPAGDEIIRVRFYGARAGDGLPDSGDVLLERTFLNLPLNSTGRTIAVQGGPDEYFFEADLGAGILLMPNTMYWLEIAQIGIPNSTFRWETGFGAVPRFAFKGNATSDEWETFSGSLAFQLSTVPEPTTVGLVFVGALCVSQRRAKWRMPGK